VPVQTVFDYLEGGETLEDFLQGVSYCLAWISPRRAWRSETPPTRKLCCYYCTKVCIC